MATESRLSDVLATGANEPLRSTQVETVVRLVFEAAGAATAPLLADHPDYVFPSERVAAGVARVLREHGIDVGDLSGYTIDAAPASLESIRDDLMARVCRAIAEGHTAGAIADEARALRDVEAIIAARPKPAAPPAIDVDQLAVHVWNAAQEPDVLSEHFPGFACDGFGASAIADVAVAALRRVLGTAS